MQCGDLCAQFAFIFGVLRTLYVVEDECKQQAQFNVADASVQANMHHSTQLGC